MTDPNVRRLRHFIETIWNRGDAAAVPDLVAPAYTIHSDPGDPWDGQTLDHRGFVERLQQSRAHFPNLYFQIHHALSVEGSRVALAWTMTGHHRGDLMGLPALGQPIEIKGLTIYTLHHAKVSGHWQVVDRLAVLQQLGLLGHAPPPDNPPPSGER